MKRSDTLLEYALDPAGFAVLKTSDTTTRVWFLGDGIVRLRTSFNGDFREESLSLLKTAWPDRYDGLLGAERQRVQPLLPTVEEQEKQLYITCDSLILSVQKEPFSISIARENAPISFRDVPGRAYTFDKGRINHSFCIDESSFYGFGEKTGHLEKTGQRMRMSNKDACGYDPVRTDPLYKHLPWFLKLSADGRETCGIFYNTCTDCELDIGREYNGYWPRMGQYECHAEEVDLFYVAGPTMKDAVQRFAKLTGTAAMLPRYAFGYLGSTMYYSELPKNCGDAILGFVDKAKHLGIPCTNFQLSSGYTTDTSGRRNVFHWNREKFPAPDKFIADMEARGAVVTPNIKPGILTTNPVYDTFREAGAFIRTADGQPYVTQFWGGKGSLVDFSNPDARKLWQQHLEKALLNYGIHSVWNDNNEFDITDSDAICINDGNPTPAYQVRGRLPMLMAITAKQALTKAYPGKRLYQVTRSGNAGIGRYAQTWTGDNSTCWESLRYNIATMLGSGLSGIAHTGSDIGGFAGPAPERELFLRWIWCGVLLPRFSIHSANNDNTVTEPWMYPEYMDAVRKAFALRKQLMPYFYSLNAHAHKTGEPLLRPMVYEFPEDPKVRYEDVNFMLGDALLASCVVEKGAVSREVYLPAGERFYEFRTRTCYEGGQIVTVPAPMDDTPPVPAGRQHPAPAGWRGHHPLGLPGQGLQLHAV